MCLNKISPGFRVTCSGLLLVIQLAFCSGGSGNLSYPNCLNKKFMGKLCNQARNACVENYHAYLPNGTTACGEKEKRGKCVAYLGTNEYDCLCEPGWTDEKGNNFRDCLATKDCASLVCVNGHCSRNQQQSGQFICNCDFGWAGRHCETRINLSIWQVSSSFGNQSADSINSNTGFYG